MYDTFSSLPAEFAWTPERATNPDILAMYHGRKISEGEILAALKFGSLADAVSWAAAVNMTGRAHIQTPSHEIYGNSPVTVHLEMR